MSPAHGPLPLEIHIADPGGMLAKAGPKPLEDTGQRKALPGATGMRSIRRSASFLAKV